MVSKANRYCGKVEGAYLSAGGEGGSSKCQGWRRINNDPRILWTNFEFRQCLLLLIVCLPAKDLQLG